MTKTTHLIGRDADGLRVVVDIDLRLKSGAGNDTVDHAPAPEQYLELGITGAGLASRREDIEWGGQSIDTVAAIERFEPGWDAAARDELVALWRRWHLNGMRAACAHMPAFDDLIRDTEGRYAGQVSTDLNVCPESDYRYGHAWLVEPLPADVVAQVEALQARATNDARIPAWYTR